MQKFIKVLVFICIMLCKMQLSVADGIDFAIPIEQADVPVASQSLDESSVDVSDTEEKQCLTICDRWGTQCIINQDAGRKCRRICESFVQECFE